MVIISPAADVNGVSVARAQGSSAFGSGSISSSFMGSGSDELEVHARQVRTSLPLFELHVSDDLQDISGTSLPILMRGGNWDGIDQRTFGIFSFWLPPHTAVGVIGAEGRRAEGVLEQVEAEARRFCREASVELTDEPESVGTNSSAGAESGASADANGTNMTGRGARNYNASAECYALLAPAARERLLQAASRGYRPILFDLRVDFEMKHLRQQTFFLHEEDIPSLAVGEQEPQEEVQQQEELA
eukprot:g849.t1